MNRKLGFYSALIVTITTALFLIGGLIMGHSNLAYFVCLLLSWGYVLIVCSLSEEVKPERKAAANSAIAFAAIYSVLINIVYFTQLTTVAHKMASSEAMNILSYQTLGSLMFNLDLLGYAIMALSTFLIGLAIHPINKSDKWLKALLMIHGIFTPVCVLFPIFNVFHANAGNSGAIYGTIGLCFWCVYFIIVGVLSCFHFRKENKN